MDSPEFLKANAVWNFGDGAGLDFNGVAPTPIATPGYYMNRGGVSVADPRTGTLLFYSDGSNCYNREHSVMPNGDALVPSAYPDPGIQGVCAVPFLSDPQKYYLFHMEAILEGGGWIGGSSTVGHKLYYSVIDMRLDSGRGDIVAGQKGILVDSSLTSSIIAVPGNNCDIWLIAHSTSDPEVFEEPFFKAYQITPAGINLTPVVSVITGSAIATANPPPTSSPGLPTPQAYATSNMAISPDRERLALGVWSGDYGALYPDGPLGWVTNFNSPPMDMTSNNPGTTFTDHAAGLLAYKFDPNTGIVSEEIFVRNLGAIGGVSFSPDSKKLYANLQGPVNCLLVNCVPPFDYRSGSTLSQYDVSIWDSATIVNSKFDVFRSEGLGDLEDFTMRLYRDTLYFRQYGIGGYIGRINNPNLAGAACNYQDSAIQLLAGTSQYGQFPNQIVYPPRDTLYNNRELLICGALDSTRIFTDTTGYAYLWEDSSTEPYRMIYERGAYRVTYFKDCAYVVDSIFVGGTADIDLQISYDSLNCHGEATLTTDFDADAYLWSNGSNGSSITVQESGTYWLEVQKAGCRMTDTARVEVLTIDQDLGADTIVCKGDPIDLRLHATGDTGLAYVWSTGARTGSIQVKDTGTYWLMVSKGPCVATDTVKIIAELCECWISAPNAFSPNGDGINDVFLPTIEQGCDNIRYYALDVYNRFGQKIFSSPDPFRGWDGTYGNGRPAEVGSYFYQLQFQGGTKGQKQSRKGDIILLR